MKRYCITILLLVAALFLVAPVPSAHAADSRFLVVAPHKAEDCLKALDEAKDKGPTFLAKFNWGCMAGDHTGYAVVDAKDEASVRKMLPASMASTVKITKVTPFTAEQIKSFHEMHK